MTTTTASGWLQRLGLVRFTGSDAAQFLQGQISHDTRRLGEGRPLFAAYSTPQGRVVALLHLIPHSSGIIAVVPRDIVTATVERLRKFVLRAKVKVEDISEQFAVLGVHAQATLPLAIAPPPAGQDYHERDGIGVSRIGASARFWVIGDAQRLMADTRSGGPPGSGSRGGDSGGHASALERVDEQWRLANIRAGMSQIYAPTQELFVAQMLNLDLLDGISFSKGCYTGQEIIARTQHLGRIKRRSFRLGLPAGAYEIGQVLQLADGRSGRLTEVAASGDGFEALAVLSLQPGVEAEASGGAVPAIAAVELPLPYSLTASA